MAPHDSEQIRSRFTVASIVGKSAREKVSKERRYVDPRPGLAPAMTAYDSRPFDFRVWWVREYGKIRPGNLLRYILTRKVWNPTGGMKETLYIKKGL